MLFYCGRFLTDNSWRFIVSSSFIADALALSTGGYILLLMRSVGGLSTGNLLVKEWGGDGGRFVGFSGLVKKWSGQEILILNAYDNGRLFFVCMSYI